MTLDKQKITIKPDKTAGILKPKKFKPIIFNDRYVKKFEINRNGVDRLYS